MSEAIRWLEEGRTYQWMVEEYRRKYHIDTTISMWAALRRRHGIGARIVRDDALIPWAVKSEHRHAHAVSMLRAEARKRAGRKLTPKMAEMLAAWLRGLATNGTVVHYDTDEGWRYVPRREEDTDLIRVPERKTGRASCTSATADSPAPWTNGDVTMRVVWVDPDGNEVPAR